MVLYLLIKIYFSVFLIICIPEVTIAEITVPVGSCKFMNSFSNRVVNIWNLLQYETVNASSLASFSSRLSNFNLSCHLVGRALE